MGVRDLPLGPPKAEPKVITVRGDGPTEYFFSNHDRRSQWCHYRHGVHNDRIARLMAALLLTALGTPQSYFAAKTLGLHTHRPRQH